MSRVEKLVSIRIAELRKATALTQEQLAEKVGVVTETISRLERGRSVPSLARLEEIASALNVDLYELFRFDSKRTAKDRELDRLMSFCRMRSMRDLVLMREIAARVFKHYS